MIHCFYTVQKHVKLNYPGIGIHKNGKAIYILKKKKRKRLNISQANSYPLGEGTWWLYFGVLVMFYIFDCCMGTHV